MWPILLAVALAQTAPTPEAEALGLRLARTSGLAALLPMVTGKESEELIAEHPELSDAEKAELRAQGKAIAEPAIERLVTEMGHRYAAALSVEDLTALVAFAESPVAARGRAAEPGVLIGAATALGEFDYKGSVRKAMCARTGKLCEQ